MSDVSDRYATIADGFTARVQAVPSDAWGSMTPCEDWTARDLVAHVVATHRRVLATVDGGDVEPVDADGDLLKQWRVASDAILEALGDEARASKVVGGIFGEQPFESLVGRLLCADTLLHTWDLANGTEQDERLDPAGVTAALTFLTPLDDAIRRPGGFAPKIDPPADADEQTRLLCFAGRRALSRRG